MFYMILMGKAATIIAQLIWNTCCTSTNNIVRLGMGGAANLLILLRGESLEDVALAGRFGRFGVMFLTQGCHKKYTGT